jgi:hypothetical protein
MAAAFRTFGHLIGFRTLPFRPFEFRLYAHLFCVFGFNSRTS